MPLFLKNPIFPAILLTAVISGICMALVGMPGQVGAAAGDSPSAGPDVSVEASEPILQDLMQRVERLEGELGRVTSSSREPQLQEPQLMAMLEGFRSEIELFRNSQGLGDEVVADDIDPNPSSSGSDSGIKEIEEERASSESHSPVILHEQVFTFPKPVIPESLVIIQGAEAGHPVLVEFLDRHGNWIEIYANDKPFGKPAAESWLDCPGAPMTGYVRISVEGGSGIETVAAQRGESLTWTEYSD